MAKNRTMPDSYFTLVRKFPLVRIRDEDHLTDALAMIDRLLQQDLDHGEQDYLTVLTDLVEAYEDEHHPIEAASEADVLRELMRTNDLTQTKLAHETGIAQSTISAVLTDQRSLTKDQVKTLAKRFRVSTAALLRT